MSSPTISTYATHQPATTRSAPAHPRDMGNAQQHRLLIMVKLEDYVCTNTGLAGMMQECVSPDLLSSSLGTGMEVVARSAEPAGVVLTQ